MMSLQVGESTGSVLLDIGSYALRPNRRTKVPFSVYMIKRFIREYLGLDINMVDDDCINFDVGKIKLIELVIEAVLGVSNVAQLTATYLLPGDLILNGSIVNYFEQYSFMKLIQPPKPYILNYTHNIECVTCYYINIEEVGLVITFVGEDVLRCKSPEVNLYGFNTHIYVSKRSPFKLDVIYVTDHAEYPYRIKIGTSRSALIYESILFSHTMTVEKSG